MNSKSFKEVHFLLDLVMGTDDHYKSFIDVYGTNTTEEIVHLFNKGNRQRYSHTHLLYNMLVMWVLLFSVTSATSGNSYSQNVSCLSENMQNLKILLEIYPSATTEEIFFPDMNVGIRNHSCDDPIEKTYYSAYKEDPICIY